VDVAWAMRRAVVAASQSWPTRQTDLYDWRSWQVVKRFARELTDLGPFDNMLFNAIRPRERRASSMERAMTNKHMIIGRVINATGMVGVSAGVLLFTFGIVLLVFRRGLGLDIPSLFHWFWW